MPALMETKCNHGKMETLENEIKATGRDCRDEFSHINNLIFSVFDSKKVVWDEAVSYIHFLFLLHCNKHYRCPFFVS